MYQGVTSLRACRASPCPYAWPGPAGGLTPRWGSSRLEPGETQARVPSWGCKPQRRPPGTSPWQQPPTPPPESLHLAHPQDKSKVPGCGKTSIAAAGPREKATRPTSHEEPLRPSPAPASTPASNGRPCFKSSINADNSRIKLHFIIFAGCRYADDMRPRCIYIQIEDFY